MALFWAAGAARPGSRSAAKAFAALAAAWFALEWLTGDPRLLFPFAMACAGACARAWGWPGALAGGAGFLLFRFVAGASAAVLATEAVGTAMALGAGLLARRAGPWAEASAVSAAALLALLL